MQAWTIDHYAYIFVIYKIGRETWYLKNTDANLWSTHELVQITVGANSPTPNILDYMHPTSSSYYFSVLSKCSINRGLLRVW